ncbi:tRNA (adenosine(37)-N6)-threonylcarbamoyltransferase complex dimerization subunit type 1 TsaB [Candidatus Latescibacterota bacterium]
MTILGIETATPRLSVALFSESPLFFEERAADSQSSHCELISGFIESLVEKAGITLGDLDGIAVSLGPGSFTGLRIGIASAMGLAYGLDIPACGVSTLMGIAWLARLPGTLVCPLIDAKRGEVYTALYRLKPNAELPDTIKPPSAMSVQQLINALGRVDEPVTLTGPGAGLFGPAICDSLGSSVITLAEHTEPSARAIATLGFTLIKAGQAGHPTALRPVYLRRSDAEIARDSRCTRP